MARRDLNLVKLCYAEATWLFARLERESERRALDEAQVATELAIAEKRIQAAPDAETRKHESDAAIEKIASIAIAAFDYDVKNFNDRIKRLRARRPTTEMVAALDLIQDRIVGIEREVSVLREGCDGTSLLSALAQEPAIECRTVHGLLCTCEKAANSVRGWLGSRRDWVIAAIVAVVVGLALIPVTLMISDWWNAPSARESDDRQRGSERGPVAPVPARRNPSRL